MTETRIRFFRNHAAKFICAAFFCLSGVLISSKTSFLLFILLLLAACDGGAGPEPRVPTSIAVTSAPQSGTVGSALAQPLRVTVTDQDGDPLEGAVVHWSVVAGGGTIAPDSSTSNSLGVAEAVFTLGPLAGEHAAVATLSATGSVRFDVTATGGAPATITATRDSLQFRAIGDTAHIATTVKDQFGNTLSTASVVWTTSSNAVVNVTAAGVVESRGAGSAEVRGAAGDARIVIPVVVEQEPAALALTPPADTLRAIEATAALTAEVTDPNGHVITGADVEFVSSDTTVVTVDDAGTVTARSPGTATITATAGAASDQATIVVRPEIASVEILPSADTLTAIGDTMRVTARALDANGFPLTDATLVFQSFNQAVATVDASGLVRAVAAGSTLIEAASGNTKSTAAITVAPVTANIELTPAAATLTAIGDTTRFTARALDANGFPVASATIVFRSLNPAIATIDANGLVRAVAVGNTQIEAASGGRLALAPVTVSPAVSSITLLPAADTLTAIGNDVDLTAVARDANGNVIAGAAITFSSSHPAIATVSSSGRVVAVAPGTATITARSGAAAKTAVILVRQRVASLAIVGSTDTMRVIGDTETLRVEAEDANGHAIANPDVTWSSLRTSVATVGSTGIVTAKSRGDARIVAASAGHADTVTVDVIPWGRITVSFELNRWEIYDIVFPILKRYGMTANVEVVTGWVEDAAADRLTLSEIRALHSAGWAVVPHSVSLTDVTLLSDADMREELLGSKEWVQDHGFRGAETLIVPLHTAGDREWKVIRANFTAARSRGYEAAKYMVTWPPEDPYIITAAQGEDYLDSAAKRNELVGLAQKAIHEGLLLEIFFHRVRESQAGVFEAFVQQLVPTKPYMETFAELFED